MELTTETIIERLGGKDAAKTFLQVSDWALFKWHKSGIPPRRWKSISDKTGLSLDEVSQARPSRAA